MAHAASAHGASAHGAHARVLDLRPDTNVEPAPAEDDAALIRGTLAGRRADFDALVERYQKMLYAFIYRFVHDHEQTADVLQTTFLQAYAHLTQFSGRSSFKTWLHQIALNQCRQLHRSDYSRRHVALEETHEANLAAPDTAESNPGLKGLLERLIARLPLRQREVLTLRIFSDLPFKEIARIEGMTENSAKVNYHHAIARLRRWLRESES